MLGQVKPWTQRSLYSPTGHASKGTWKRHRHISPLLCCLASPNIPWPRHQTHLTYTNLMVTVWGIANLIFLWLHTSEAWDMSNKKRDNAQTLSLHYTYVMRHNLFYLWPASTWKDWAVFSIQTFVLGILYACHYITPTTLPTALLCLFYWWFTLFFMYSIPLL